jgi:predicted outer membrane repeat protein
MKKLSFLVVLLCLATANLWARVVYVDSSNVAGFQDGTSWITAYSSFQAGIDDAFSGDSVWVATATYSPAINTSFSMKDGVEIYGGFTNTASSFNQRNTVTNVTILKGNNTSVFFNHTMSNASLLDGFTITNGKTSFIGGGGMSNSNNASPTINNCIFSKDTADSPGGAIRNYGASPVITNCTFSQNVSTYAGGAICNSYFSMPVISNCSFSNNKIIVNYSGSYAMGGAIYNQGGSYATISNCSFTANEVKTTMNSFGAGEASGGAIYNDMAGFEMSNCTFSGNLVSNIGTSTTNKGLSKGAAIFTNGKTIIENCTFSGNIAFTGTRSTGQGTIYSIGGTDSTHLINNSVFSKNNATQGGAIYSEISMSKVTNCTFSENKAIYGGAVYNKKSAPLFINCTFSKDTAVAGAGIVNDEVYFNMSFGLPVDGTIANCLFTKNVADSFGGAILNQKVGTKIVNATIVNDTTLFNSGLYGGGIYNRQNSFPSISNTIVWGNSSGIVNDLSSLPSVFYSLVQGYPANATNHLIAGSTNPLFQNAANGDFRLQLLSPCFNKGNNDSLDANITVDRGGSPRITKDTIDIGAYEYIVMVNLGPDTTTCSGDTLTLDAGNTGSAYLWNTGATTQTIKVTTNGTYNVAVTNVTGTATDTISVQFMLPNLNIGNDTAFCSGNSITITAPLSDSYLWSTGATTRSISVSSSGAYIIKVTDTLGCSNRDTINVMVNPLPVVNIGNDTAICDGSTLVLNAQNTGSTYLWNTGATTQTIAVLSAGDYNVRVTDANSCAKADTITVGINLSPNVNLGSDTAICDGITLIIDAQNTGDTYLWNTGAISQTIGVTTTGDYRVTVTDPGNGCFRSDTIHVTVNPLPVVSLGNDTAICDGSNIVLDAQNSGATYLWNTTASTQTINVTIAGSFDVVVTDANGCVNTDTINVVLNPLPVVALGNDTAICDGADLLLDAQNAGAAYQWNTSDATQIISVTTAGSFDVVVTDANGCKNTDTINVALNPLPVVALGNDTAICDGADLLLDAQNAGAAYQWNTTASTQTINVTTAGSFDVVVTDANRCVNTDTINVALNALPVVALGNDTAICDGSTLTLDAMNSGGTYLWNNGAITQTLDVSVAGAYDVMVTDVNNCSNSDTIQISINPLPVVNLGNDTTLFPNIILTLNAANAGATYLWNTGATTQTIDVDENGTYIVNVTDVNTCTNHDTIIVKFIPTDVNNTILENAGVTVIPNPAKEYIVINITEAKILNTKAVLTDMSGRNVLITDIREAQQKISLQGLTAGTYILRLQNNLTYRIIKLD